MIFDNYKIGQRVWDIEYGWGEIVTKTTVIRVNPKWQELPGFVAKYEITKNGEEYEVAASYDLNGYRHYDIRKKENKTTPVQENLARCLYFSESEVKSDSFIM